jgi:hypothetical protein
MRDESFAESVFEGLNKKKKIKEYCMNTSSAFRFKY